MGQRRDPRVKMVLPIRVAGRDADGKAFSQLAHTLDFSRSGARIGGVQAALQVGDELTVSYKRGHGRFRVQWVNANRLEVGVQNLEPGKFCFMELPYEQYEDQVEVSNLRRNVVPTTTPPSLATGVAHLPVEVEAAAVEPRAMTSPATVAGRLADLKRALRETKEDPDGALQLVATGARELLSASGAAVALAGGDDWICRASSGVGPRVGVRFQSPQGLTGQAAVSGNVVICRDTEEDHRVNAAIWRSVQLRSAASVPIMRETKALGVLEVFADRPNAFSEEHGRLLLELGELLAELITTSSSGGK